MQAIKTDKILAKITSQYKITESSIDVLRYINLFNDIKTNTETSITALDLANGDDNYNIELSLSNLMALLDPGKSIDSSTGEAIDLGLGGTFEDFITGGAVLDDGLIGANEALSPMGQYLKDLRSLNENNQLPPKIQAFTNILSKEIFNLADNVKQKSSDAYNTKLQAQALMEGMIPMIESGNPYVDESYFEGFNTPYSNVTTLKGSPSTETDLDLHLICSSRGGRISGRTCSH